MMAKTPYSPKNPCKFTIQTTRGFKPKDYEDSILASTPILRHIPTMAWTGFYLVESLVRLRLALLADLLAHLVLPATALALPSPRSSPACSNPPSPRR